MLTHADVTNIGHILKPHGIKGEVVAVTDTDLAALSCVLLEMEGLLTPFFVEGLRQRGGESWLVKIDGIDSEQQAKTLCGNALFALNDELSGDDSDGDDDGDDDGGMYAEDFIGYSVVDAEAGQVGVIEDIDDSTDNVLFIVRTPEGATVYIPVAEEFIADFDEESKTLNLNLPQGLLEL
ncbi:MAG: 16S rRNA processing protein RimM [Muribaculaceae bacterium]|nr:16S rRNA processing protein RimM [Muribaculaceae bacterium]